MLHTKSLRTYPDMRAAIASIDTLYEGYLKANKKKASTHLVVSTTSSEDVEVRIKFLDGQEKEVEWFVGVTK
jgi:hypothetical protein